MRIVPCRVVCYYKFNVKSGSKKMRERDLGIWNGSIHLPFLLVSKCAQRKGKSKGRKTDFEEEKSFYTRPHIVAYFTLFFLVQVTILGFFLLLSSVMIRKIVLMRLWFHVSAPRALFERKTLFICDSHLQMHFSSCTVSEESTCVIMDKVFHSLSVFFYCCYVSVSVKRTTLERDYCSWSRCQWRRGHS